MPLNKKVKRELRNLAIIIFLATTFTFIMCPECSSNFTLAWKIMVFNITIWISLWKGNEYLAKYQDKIIPWFDNPTKSFFIRLTTFVGYTSLMIWIIFSGFDKIFGFTLSRNLLLNIGIAIGIGMFIAFFLSGRSFLLAWKASALNEERLRRENISSQYEVLKNQVNPHFLFNSLNALTRLVYEDPDVAANYIKQLSEFYRFVLETRDKEVVSLKSELDFLEVYIFLQQKRFKESLITNIDIPDQDDIVVPPLVLQMLVENAIKHNEISHDRPLFIDIHRNNENEIVVKNNLQPRTNIKTGSPGIGIENIRQRYSFLSDKKMKISEEAGTFSVKLPILKLQL